MKENSNLEVADNLMEYGLYLMDTTDVTWSSMNTYMGEAKKVLEIKGEREKIVLRAKHAAVIAELKRMRKVKAKRKKALTARMLRRWRRRLEKSKNGGTKNQWAAWVSMALMFYGLLRGSEVIGRQGKREGLRWSNVTFLYKDGKLDAVDLFIERSKTDAFGFGATVRIFLDDDEPANPVRWLHEKFKEEGPEGTSFVAEGATKGKAVSYYLVNSSVQQAAKLEGENGEDWGTHSGRAGGCTAMFLGGATGDQVKAAGRWASDVYWRYVRTSPWTKKKWMKAMSGKDKGPTWAIPLDEMQTPSV